MIQKTKGHDMRMTRVHDATAAAQELEEMLLESSGELTDEMEGQFAILTQQAESLPAAIDDVLALVRDIEIRAEARKAEAKRIADRAKRDESIAAWFKDQVLRVMQNEGMKKLETTRFRATVAMPGGKAALELVGDVPPEYVEQQIIHVTDKEKIRAELEQGKTLCFARLVEKQPYLRIS
jgi:hypothetical protein